MPQLFSKQSNWIVRSLFFGGPVFLILILSAAEALDRSTYITDQGQFVPQPIPFSHKHHAGQMGLSCLYCHNQSEKGRFAQIPASQVCAGCHQVIWNQSPTLQPVLESQKTGQPVIWNKITKIPAYVYFDHEIHVRELDQAQLAEPGGLPSEHQLRNTCTLCHGSVETMPLTELAHPMTMEFCLNCHREPAAYLQRHSIEIRRGSHLESKMDCVTCHR